MKGMTTEEFDNFHDHVKCKWLDCKGGFGLAGHGICAWGGDWNNPDCSEYETCEEFESKKRCTKCKRIKLLSEFNQDKRLKSGKRSCCRDCDNIAEVQRMSDPKYRRRRLAQASETAKKPDRRMKKYKSNKLWAQNNISKVKEYNKTKGKKRRNSLVGRLNNSIGADICKALSGQKRGRHWEYLVGYTAEQLRKHLEKNFLPNMTWKNRSEWHIDHIIPKSAFNYKTPEDIDFKKCWALRNLRPIWIKDNLKKWNKLDRPFQPSFSFAGDNNARNE